MRYGRGKRDIIGRDRKNKEAIRSERFEVEL